MFSIFDCTTDKRISDQSYSTREEANHDYFMNEGHTYIDVTVEYRMRTRLPRIEDLSRVIGSQNWVLHRRTNRIVERYGKDVVCLTRKQYESAVSKALEMLA
jgi:hypothetical protein